MKSALLLVTLFATLKLVAAPFAGILCHEDNRLHDGAMREVFLKQGANGYVLQSQFIASLTAPEITSEIWADALTCKIEEKLAYCKNDKSTVQIKERRETYYDSLDEHAKKKTNKLFDILIQENGVEKKMVSFAANHCQAFGGEA